MNASKPIKILHVVGGMNRGGVETWLLNVLRQIDRKRFQMDFLVHTEQPCAYDEEIRSLGSKIIPCPYPSRLWTYRKNFSRIWHELGPYDIIHSHVYLFSGFVLYLATRLGVKYRIAHIYPLKDQRPQTVARKIFQHLSLRLISSYADFLLTISQHTHDLLKATPNFQHKPSAVIYCGIDISKFQKTVDRERIRKELGLPIDKPIIIYVARFEAHKNHAQMIRIAKRLNVNEYRFHFVMAGSHGNRLEAIKEEVAGRNDFSLLVGMTDISELMLASDLFLFPSLHEGFGIVAVEAAAAGLPIVATNLPTIREACPPGHHSYMFPPDDDDTACGNILEILNNDAIQKSLSIEAKKWVEIRSILVSVRELMAIYQKVT